MNWYSAKRKLRKYSSLTSRHLGTVIAILALLISITTAILSYINTIRSERAFMVAEAANAFNVSAGNRLQGYVKIVNIGKSLARIKERKVGITIGGIETPDNFENIGAITISEPGKFVAWPNQPHFIFRTLRETSDKSPLTEQEVEQLRYSARRIYVFGSIKYEDIFGYERETVFCHMYYGSEMAIYPNNGGQGYDRTQAKYCEKNNRAN